VHSLDQNLESPILGLANEAARRVFGFNGLRLEQVEVLKHVLTGKDALAVMPTGSGKSMTYVIPALLGPGLVVVLSPLIALIRDQVIKLRRAGVPAAALDSHQSPEEKKQVIDALRMRRVKILFVSPERFSLPKFRDFLNSLEIKLFAIDEAHCISQWGYNFRPEYRKIGDYLQNFSPSIPRLALTATATKRVREDILSCLQLRNVALIIKNPIRSNLETSISRASKVEEAMDLLINKIWQSNGQGIIYAGTRQKVEDVARRLQAENISNQIYHAGLSPDVREKAQKSFLNGELRVIVATNAFGLGVDKPDIRFVHHMGMPQSLEQYIQEIGRAGRDGGYARCEMVYTSRDYHVQKFLIEKSHPSLSTIKKTYEVARDHGLLEPSSFEFIRLLIQITQISKEEAHTSIDLLVREGWLVRTPTAHGDFRIHVSEKIGVEDFFLAYQERRDGALNRLDTMFHYLASGNYRSQFLEHYFLD